MDISEILKSTPQSLAKTQYDALLEYTLDILRAVATHLKKGELEEAEGFLEFSPSGDGTGRDNNFILFPLKGGDVDTDLGDVIERLIYLKATAEKDGRL